MREANKFLIGGALVFALTYGVAYSFPFHLMMDVDNPELSNSEETFPIRQDD